MSWVWWVAGLLHPAPVCEFVHPEPVWSGLAPVGELDSLVAEGPASLLERLEIERWREACPHDRRDAPVFALLGLLRLEKVLGVDRWRPGLLGAVWCIEAAWSKKRPLWGDWRGDHPMAHGPFQLWLSSRQTCSLTPAGAQDLAASARCWVMQVETLRVKAARVCRGDEVTLSRVAEAAVSNVRRYQWGCRYSSAHWKVAMRGLPDPPPVPRVSRP